jgi:RHS repeat-associated protein
MDVGTQLTYMQQRYYDPSIGRFLVPDPISTDRHTGAGFNRFAYAANSPLSFADPDGRKEKPFDAKVDAPRNVIPETETFLKNPDGSPNADAFNCHSMAWHDGQGDPNDPQSQVEGSPQGDDNVVNDVLTARAEGRQLDPNEPNQLGDVVVYGTDTDGDGQLSVLELWGSDVHSATVSDVDADGNTTRVTSKEGQLNITDSHPSDVNPAYGKFKEWYRP